MRAAAVTAALLLATGAAGAGEADVIGAEIFPEGGDRYGVAVTVRHADEGWDHYADAWQVLAPDGTILGTRELVHPHETEQPFTRRLSGVVIPAGLRKVTIRARDSVHGFGGAEVTVRVPR